VNEQIALLPQYLSAHVRLVTIALIVCALFSVPLGILATRSPRAERVVLGIASVIQTIPTLALLAVMVPLLGALHLPAIGVLPALVGLTLYCSLPILISTVTGIREVSPALLEAARGVGMKPGEVLRMVELPLASPFIVAGLRTSTVWCVGMATLSTPIGAPSLGNFIFGGLQTRNHAATLTGCIAAACLALILDAVVRTIEVGLRKRNRARVLAGAAAIGVLALYTLVSSLGGLFTSTAERPVRIGGKPFTEQYILGHVMGGTIQRESKANVEMVESLGSTVAFDALASGDLDVYVDYSGTLWTTVLKHTEPPGDRQALLATIGRELEERFGIQVAARLGFENTYCLAIRDADAKRFGIEKLSQLAPRSHDMVIGGDYEFFARSEWTDLKKVYGYAFKEQRSMDPSVMYQATAEKQVDVISAYSTDGRIAAFELRALTDDRHVIPPYDAVVLVSKRLASERPEIVAALRKLEGRLDAAKMRELNRQVDQEGTTPAEVARRFLAD
jgi:osmoprotectant transport system permease protein